MAESASLKTKNYTDIIFTNTIAPRAGRLAVGKIGGREATGGGGGTAAGGEDVSSFGQALSTGAKAGFTVLPMNRARGSGYSTALKTDLEDEEGSLRVGLAPCRLACRPYQQER